MNSGLLSLCHGLGEHVLCRGLRVHVCHWPRQCLDFPNLSFVQVDKALYWRSIKSLEAILESIFTSLVACHYGALRATTSLQSSISFRKAVPEQLSNPPLPYNSSTPRETPVNMAPPTGMIPREDFHILPITPIPSPILMPRFTEGDHTLITIISVLSAAILVSLLAIWLLRRRLTHSNNILANFRPAERTARNPGDVEASASDVAQHVSTDRGCVPNFSNPLGGAEKSRGTPLPDLEWPRTTEDLKKLGRETRLGWKAESLGSGGSTDIGSERLTRIPGEAGSCGRSLTGRPRGAVSC